MNYFPPATKISIIQPYNGKNLLSISPGWYFVQLITSILMSRLKEIQSLSNLTFTTRYQVYPGCYSFYLTEKQLILLNQYKEINVIPYPTDKYQPNKEILLSDETGRCKVKSIPKWEPKDRSYNFSILSEDIYIVNTSCSSLLPDPRIEYLAPYSGKKPQNRYITGFIQSGSQEGVFENGSLVSPHPLFNLGIHGEGQILSITDTGVDFNHPFFFDPAVSIQINATMENHRKIKKYYNFAKENDGPNGHGTHCAGILTGESYIAESGLILYSGMAPKARLVVVDVGYGGRDLDGEFNQFEMFDLLREDGVSISSNSWGFEACEDTKMDTAAYDYISYLHPDILLVFAAGNEGNRRQRFYTINSPGDSKNILSVGGLSQTRLRSIESAKQWKLEINGNRYVLAASSYGLNPLQTTRGYPMRKLANLTIIDLDDQKGIQNYSNKIVFLDDTDKADLFCSTFMQMQGTHGIPEAVIHIQTNYSICNNTKFNFTIFELNDQAGNSTQEDKNLAVSLKGQIKLASTASIYEHLPESSREMSLGGYSSRGPSPLGLCKPDIVVPGFVTSSSALKKQLTPDCLSVKWGTSMATAAAAGSCSLVRQYFTDGFYPHRVKSEVKSFAPMSYLIRAVIVNSASPFDSDNYGPNIMTGFGSPNLSSSLLQPLRIVKNNSILANSKHRYEINLNQNNDSLRVTMGYIDPPLSLSSAVPLFADLDLLVVSPSGRVFIGNERPNNQTEMANTIERVIVRKEQIEVGKYVILVLSNNFSDPDLDTINYSLVINGPFDHFDFQSNPEEPAPILDDRACEFKCLNNGVCGSSGICVCDDDHAGFDCSIEFKEMSFENDGLIQMVPVENQYFKVPVKKFDTRVNISITAEIHSNNDKRSSLLIYASDNKFSSISDVKVMSIQLNAKKKEALNITVSPSQKDEPDFALFLALKIVSYQNVNVSITFKMIDFHVNESEISQPPSFQYSIPSENSIPSQIFEKSNSKSAERGGKGLYKISLLLACVMAALCIALIALIVVLIMQKRLEINQFYSREDEPSLVANNGNMLL